MLMSEDLGTTEKRGAEILVRLSMLRQCAAICVKRAIYFSRSWRECPQRNFGREESDSVSFMCERAWYSGAGAGAGNRAAWRRGDKLDTCCRADVASPPRSSLSTQPSLPPLFAQKENSRCG